MREDKYNSKYDIYFFIGHIIVSVFGYVVSWADKISVLVRLIALPCFCFVVTFLYFSIKGKVLIYRWFVNIILSVFVVFYSEVMTTKPNTPIEVYTVYLRFSLLSLPYFGSVSLFCITGFTEYWMVSLYICVVVCISIFGKALLKKEEFLSGGRKQVLLNLKSFIADILFIIVHVILDAILAINLFPEHELMLSVICFMFAAVYLYVIFEKQNNYLRVYRPLLIFALSGFVVVTILLMVLKNTIQNTIIILLAQHLHLFFRALITVFTYPFQLLGTRAELWMMLYLGIIVVLSCYAGIIQRKTANNQ